ncbi:MAG: alpha-amylase family glycosyl hydrolase [Eubacteriales bacterium]|nr:alpha-amylase family glycosyl hydrolase [Eubacteriales bacterium]
MKGSDLEKVVFNSRDPFFRDPVGPAPSGTEIRFRILTEETFQVQKAWVVVIFDRNNSVARYQMAKSETRVETDTYVQFEVSFAFHDTGLYWYSFELETPEGIKKVSRSLGDNRAEIADGIRVVSWQHTVYRRLYPVPKWIEGGVFYHIFVDRFAKSGPDVEMPGKITRHDWGGEPVFRPDGDGKIRNRDFFGGNLAGIRKKLPYLQDLGVTCLYLSPIFEAYSNHKYDTADYQKIDPMFGDGEEFRKLCQEAKNCGIRIVLDGVFSHTGSDSVYFDKEERYGQQGAYHHPDSPYRSWYYLDDRDRYQSWWGIDTLPRLNKEDPSYVSFITGKDGIVRKWLREGASGWRLDVADELPNSFLHALSKAAKEEKPESILIGEVWEDASNKSSYGERKNYFDGSMLDSVMNYPLRNAIIGFVRYRNARELSQTVEEILENYPPEVVHCLMNILGTHDTERILTALGGRELPAGASREEMAKERMNAEEMRIGIRRLKIAAALQMTLPGVPCIYYGDEAGMEGYRDPFNRRCYPWGKENRDLTEWYRKIIRIRRECPVYRNGNYRTVAAFRGLFAFERSLPDRPDLRMMTAVNIGPDSEVLISFGRWKDLLTGEYYQDNMTVFPGQVLILRYMEDLRLEAEEEEKEEIMEYMKQYERWLSSEAVDEKTKEELRSISGNEEEIKGRFSKMLDFGTAGLRGVMRAGLFGMNVYVVRYVTQGLANLINGCGEDASGGVSISYDCRNHSREFAEEAASVLAANQIPVHFFPSLRPTPELSFAIRENHSIAGINITASHNTKEYNGYKVYWSDGAQLPPEHAQEISLQIQELDIFDDVKLADFKAAEEDGRIRIMGSEMDEAYLSQVLSQAVHTPEIDREAETIRIVYTPFHGTGHLLVPEALKRDGIRNVLTVPEQMVIDGNFPTVKSPNPEFVEGFKLAIDLAEKEQADVIIGTDPDGDRCGVCVKDENVYRSLSVNQIGVLLLDFLIRAKKANGTLPENAAAVKSIVSTTMANAICEKNGIKLFEVLTGFKYIGEKIKEFEKSHAYSFLFGFEESNGYLAGTYARDKDAVVASMLVSEMACWYRAKGMNLAQALEGLYKEYGYYREQVISHVLEGFDAQEKMDAVMKKIRENPPEMLGGLRVLRIRDYQSGLITDIDHKEAEPTGLPESNVLFYELEDGNTAVIRPSGTEPKVKLYLMTRGDAKETANQRMEALKKDGSALLQ